MKRRSAPCLALISALFCAPPAPAEPPLERQAVEEEADFRSRAAVLASELREQAKDSEGVAPASREPWGRDPWSGDRGYFSCNATTNRCQSWWRCDEHGGHYSSGPYLESEADRVCSDCVNSHKHRDCSVECVARVSAFVCKSEFVPDDGSAARGPYEGRERDNARDAEDDAVNRCRDANERDLGHGRCRVKNCGQRDREERALQRHCRSW